MGIGHRFKKLPPPPKYTTKEEVQEMIDDAIRQHNRNASISSFIVGWVVLALFAEKGLVTTYWSYRTAIPMVENNIIQNG